MPRQFHFSLGQIMAGIALLALVYAALPAPLAIVFAVLLLAVALMSCVGSALSPASRTRIACWAFAAFPLVLLASLYTTRLAAWYALGHLPRPSLDDPKSIGSIVDVPHTATWLLIALSTPAFLMSVALSAVEIGRAL